MKNGKFRRRGVATKTFAVMLALMLVVGISVGGTIAWLTATSETVKNTFVVGDINIKLAETVDPEFKIVPGGEDDKDPTLTVLAESENCYAYVCVENDVKLGDTVVATPNMNTENWIAIGTTGNKTVYRYSAIVEYSDEDQKLPVFTKVSYSSDITKGNIEELKGTTIVITGFAHQSDNTTDAVADAAALAHFGVTA